MKAEFLVCVLLAVSTLVVYAQVCRFDFVSYDDTTLYVTENPHTKAGLSRDNVVWAFTTGHASNWHPLTWLSLMLDVQLFGVNAGAFHIVNVLFHTANTVLLFLVLRRMTARACPDDPWVGLWPSAWVAALFALHPLHVESVAWISERKDVLSTFFGLLTMAAYLRYTKQPSIGRYALIAGAFALGLTAKPMLVTLPVILLLIDYWPLGRLDILQPSAACVRRFLVLAGEKLPLLLLAAISSIVTFLVQHASRSVAAFDVFPLWSRVGNAVVAYGRYLLMTAWPAGLAAFYPHPGLALAGWQVLLSFVVLSAFTVFALLRARRAPYLIVGWLWFLVTLLPVIGIVQVGSQALADRYTYVPLIGVFIMAAWGVADLAAVWRLPKIPVAVVAVAVTVVFSVCTAIQTHYWRDGVTLFQHALDVTSGNYIMHCNLGVDLLHQKRYEEAKTHFAKALEFEPRFTLARTNLGVALTHLERYDEAKVQLEKALEWEPRDVLTLNSMGTLLRCLKRYEEAEIQFRKALEVQPQCVDALANLGITLAEQGRYEEAKVPFTKAVEVRPRDVDALNNLGAVLYRQGLYDEAKVQFMKALEMGPNNVTALGNLGAVLMSSGDPVNARQYFERALQLDPANKDARNNLELLNSKK